ncbi:MAG: hypothetical protein ACE5EF_11555 [Dehalococcoidia bacterium]
MAWDIERDSNGDILFWGYRIGGGTDLGRLLDALRRLKAAIARCTDPGRVGELLNAWSELHMLMVDDDRWGGPTNGPYSEWLSDEWRDFLPSVMELQAEPALREVDDA